MTITLVQKVTIINGFSGSFASNVTIGNSLVLAATGYNGGGGSVLSSSNPLYNGSAVTGASKIISRIGANNTNGDDYASIWLLPNVQSSAKTLAITMTNSLTGDFVGIIGYEVAGLGASPSADQSAGNFGSGSSTKNSGTTGAIGHSPEFVVGVVVQDGTSGTLPSSPWTNTSSNSDSNTFSGYQIVTSSGGTYSYGSTGGSADWAAVVATIAPTAAPASSSGLLMASFPM